MKVVAEFFNVVVSRCGVDIVGVAGLLDELLKGEVVVEKEVEEKYACFVVEDVQLGVVNVADRGAEHDVFTAYVAKFES